MPLDHAWRAYREGNVGEMQGLWDIITLCDTPKLLPPPRVHHFTVWDGPP